jgi:hypothetical protein
MKKNSYSLFIHLIFFFFSINSFAATFYSRANGNWNTASTWSTTSCSGAAATSIPGAADIVIICTGKTVTMNGNPASCSSLTINGTANWTSTFTTNVGAGGVTLNNGGTISGSSVGILNVTGGLTISSGGTGTIGGITLNVTGTTTVSGTVSFNNLGGTKTFSNVIINSGGSFTSSVTENYTITGNLTMNGGSITGSNTADITVAGTFSVPSGANATVGRLTLTINGTTNINGTLTDNNLSGSKTFADLNINSGGTFFSAVNETYNINGNLTLTSGAISGSAKGRYVVSGSFTVGAGTSSFGDAWLTVVGTSWLVHQQLMVRSIF